MSSLIKEENIASLIYFIRGEKVMFDSDLAVLYGIETRVLNQAVRRNVKRFPSDFMFQLTKKEFETLKSQVVISNGKGLMSQFVISKRGGRQKLPLVFTEQGVAMLSGVLKSDRAIEVNISIMRTFVQVRKLLEGNETLTQKIKELEKLTNDRFNDHDEKFQLIFESIRQLINPPNPPRKKIGFKIGRK